jgi:hypothetical protein
VTVYAPEEAVEGTVIDSVDEPDPPVTEDGVTVAVQPEGAEGVNETVSVNPLMDVTVTVETPDDPATIVKEEGDAETE